MKCTFKILFYWIIQCSEHSETLTLASKKHLDLVLTFSFYKNSSLIQTLENEFTTFVKMFST